MPPTRDRFRKLQGDLTRFPPPLLPPQAQLPCSISPTKSF
jgi:hypothetical protein